MDARELIYLDNAATGFPKPRETTDAMLGFMKEVGGNAGRGAHPLSMAAAEGIFECRAKLARLFGATGADRVCFTLNTTHGLNLCVKGLLKRGDHVLISDMEHNAVYRPLYRLRAQGQIELDVFPLMGRDGELTDEDICAGIEKRIRRNTRMLVCSGAGNISSLASPLGAIGAICRRNGILFVVDGAQCAGHRAITLEEQGIDALCVPAHKGLLGPQGCGAVILGEKIAPQTLIEGGNGVDSLEGAMSFEMPERYEAGTLPAPAIFGLSAGLDVLCRLGIERIDEHEKILFRKAREGLESMDGIRIYTPRREGAVLLFNMEGYASEQVAELLGERGICVRGGYHCCALGHKTLGTDRGGAVRISFGPFNSSSDIDALLDAIREIKG